MFRLWPKTCKNGHLMDPSWKVCPVCIAPVIGWMVALNGPHKDKVYRIHEGKIKIGSGADCEIRLLVNSISRQHAMVTTKNGHYNICDLNSLTGTFVNNFQISNRDIIDGDIVKLGEIEFKFKFL